MLIFLEIMLLLNTILLKVYNYFSQFNTIIYQICDLYLKIYFRHKKSPFKKLKGQNIWSHTMSC